MLNQKNVHKAIPRPGEWTDVLSTDVISHFLGKHVAIISKRVVAVGDSYDTVLAESRQKYPDEMPYLVFIPNPTEEDRDEAAVSEE